jgi:hypothetical protein
VVREVSRSRLLDRRTNFRDTRIHAIAVEGAVQEVHYFEALAALQLFDARKIRLVVLGTNDGQSAPEHVAGRLKAFERERRLVAHDVRWLVVDVDRWRQNLHEALAVAVQAGWGLAVSNPCFEVWLQLHLADEPSGAVARDAKRAWGALRAAQGPTWSIDAEHVRRAADRARARHPGTDRVPEPAPGTHVYRIVNSLPRTP